MSYLIPLGRLDEAITEMALAQDLDPISSIISRDFALLHYYRRDYDGALEQCDHTIGIMPYFAPAYGMLGLVQEQLGDFDESAAAFHRALQIAPNNLHVRAALGRLYAVSG